MLENNKSTIESIARETQEAIAKLNPTQKKEVADLNDKVAAAEAVVNDPNASEEVKAVAEQQVETLSKEIDAIKPEPETKKVEGIPIKKGTDVQIDDTVELVNGKKGKVTKVEGDQVTMTMENGATFMATPELVEMTNITSEKAINEKQPEVTTEEVVTEELPQEGVQESVAELEDYIVQATEIAEQHEALAEQETDPIEKQEQLDIARNARDLITNSESELAEIRKEEVISKAEKDLSALKQVTDKVKKYDASMKRLTEAKNNKEISTTEFNDLKKRFDDVIGESTPKVKEETAVPLESNETIPDKEPTLQDKVVAIQDKRQSIKDRISQKLKEQRGNLSSGFDPSLLSDFVELGSTYIEEGVVKASDFIKRFREDYRDMGFDDSEITDKDIVDDVYSKNVVPEEETTTNVKEDTTPMEEASDKKKRSATQRVLKSNEYSQEFKDALSDETIYYSELPNAITDKEAEAFIDINGDFDAEAAIMDFNNDIGSAVRFSIMQKLIDRYEANGEYLRAAEMAETLYSKATDYGQGIQVFSTFPKLSKIGQVQLAKKNITEQRKKFRKQTEKTTNKIAKDFKKANKEAATEAVENVKKKIEQSTVVTPEGTIKELPTYGAKNKLFTRDKYIKAKQKLRGMSMSSFGGLPIDDVINIAGYHIEATGRDFARFSRRMKADLGAKIKPFLKDIYAQTRTQLIDDGYDASLFLTDEEVQAQINEDEGQRFKEKLQKAIERKDTKEQKVAIKKLQEISKEEGVWGQYKDSAASRLKNMVLTNAEKDIKTNPSLQQFTDGLVANMKAKMAELLPEPNKRKSVPRPDIEIIGDAYKNLEKYQEVWDKTQLEFQEKYANEPEVLQAIDDYFGEILDKPFSDKLIERAVNKGLSEMDTNISDLVVQHYTIVDNAKQSLSDKLVEEAGLTGSEAASLAKAIQEEFDRIATKKKQQILEKTFSKRERKKPAVRTLEGDLIKMSNLGAFRTEDVVNMYGEKMGWPALTQDNINEIERLSDIVQQTTDPIKKRRAVEDLLGYQAKIKGSSITDLVTAIWYANVLSGYNTQVVNFGANAINTALLYANAVIQRPKDGAFIAKGLINGMYRGFLEAEETLRTGYSPIKGKAEVPTLLELKKFVGGAKNPLNYLKYVRRVMVAADVIFFEGQKEMRAYQLAAREAANEGKVDPTMNQVNRAIELVGKSDGQLEAIKEEVELEYQEEVSNIQNSNVSSKEKVALLKQASSDKQRRIFDMIEQQRSSDLIQETAEYASIGTFNYQPKGGLGAIANGINTIVKDIPVLRYAVPFTNIIANVANESINYTPIGFLRRGKGGFTNFRREALTDQQKVDLTTKAAIGTTLMASLFVLSQVKGEDDEPVLEITGNGTGDYAKNETLKQTGWQPYSFRFKLPTGNYSAWYSFQYSPLLPALGFVGHFNDLLKYKKDEDKDSIATRLSKAAGLTVSTFFQGTYLDGLGDILANVLDPRASEKVTDKLIKGTLGAAKGVVLPNLYSQTAQTFESIFDIPKKEVRETLSGQLLQDIPYARNMFYDKVNILGDPIMADTDKFSSANKPNKVIELLIDKKAVFAPISRKSEKIYDIKEQKERMLTDEEFYEYSIAKGQYIKKALEKGYSRFEKMDESEFKKQMTSIKKQATKAAKWSLMKIKNN